MSTPEIIEVWADWEALGGPSPIGRLRTTLSRGKQIFSFEYDKAWLQRADQPLLDPALRQFGGSQYPAAERANFGVFLDSSPDRWGRVLMLRREALQARVEGREAKRLLESDYLLGVHDGHRMGALRFRQGAAFLDDRDDLAAPPWTSLRELEHASLQLERDGVEEDSDYGHWLRLLIAPGGSLGGARPKAGVLDGNQCLWIAKFPSRSDAWDMGAWEGVLHELARRARIDVPAARLQRFASPHHTFLSKRFDRMPGDKRLHFASAMTLLERIDGDDADAGASYLELAELLIQLGSEPQKDLEELWRRIAFFICVSNTDDHLRNHGFLLERQGWRLSPAYDMNPDPQGEGLKLNISDTDNAQNLELLMDVAAFFRVAAPQEIAAQVVTAVKTWREVATANGLSPAAQDRMRRAFRIAEKPDV